MVTMEKSQSFNLRPALRRYASLHIRELRCQIKATVPVDQLSLWCIDTLLYVKVRTSIIDCDFVMSSIRDLLNTMERLQQVIHTTDAIRNFTWIKNKELQSTCAIYLINKCAIVVAMDPLTVNEVVTELCDKFHHLITERNWEDSLDLSLVQLTFLSTTGGVMLNHVRNTFQVTYLLDTINTKIIVRGVKESRVKMAIQWLTWRLHGIFFNDIVVKKTTTNRTLVDDLKTIRRECTARMIARKLDTAHRYFALSIDEDKFRVYIKVIGLRDAETYTTPSMFSIVHERVITLIKSFRYRLYPVDEHRISIN